MSAENPVEKKVEQSQGAIACIIRAAQQNLFLFAQAAGFDPLSDFIGLDLSDASWSGVDWNGVNFSGANLERTCLTEANLSRVNLEASSCNHANLRFATLHHAQQAGIDLSPTIQAQFAELS